MKRKEGIDGGSEIKQGVSAERLAYIRYCIANTTEQYNTPQEALHLCLNKHSTAQYNTTQADTQKEAKRVIGREKCVQT